MDIVGGYILEIGDLLTLDNGEAYVVVKQILVDGKFYVYLISEDGFTDMKICLLENDSLPVVTDEVLFEQLLVKFQENFLAEGNDHE